MNNCLFYFVIFSSSIFLTSYGRKLHYGNSFAKYESKKSNDVPKLKPMQDHIYTKIKNFQAISKRMFKDNPVPKRDQSNVDYYENNIHSLQTNDLDDQKEMVVSTEIGKHLVKISSVQLQNLENMQGQKSKQELVLKPKFSHTIEIIPIDENKNLQVNSEAAGQFETKTDVTATKSQNILESNLENIDSNLANGAAITSKLESNKSDKTEIINPDESRMDMVDNNEIIFGFESSTIKSVDEFVTVEHSFDANESVNKEHLLNFNEFVTAENASDENESFNLEHLFDANESVSSENVLDSSDHVKTENEFNIDKMVTAERVFDAEELTRNENGFKTENDFELTGNQDPFDAELEGSGEDSFRLEDGNRKVAGKSGRFAFMSRNQSAPNCTTPKGEAGQCKRIRQCLLVDALTNFNVFLQHLCLIRGALVGICCPNNPVIEIANDQENVTGNVTAPEILQPPEGCGLNTKTRIVGGTVSLPHEWTWMVALLQRNRFYCGGVIINNLYVLTAAHCVMGTSVKDLSVRLGEYDFNTHNKHQEDIPVSEIKRHAQFVTLTFQHDIALLKLKRSIKYSKFVGSICLPDQKARDYSEVNATVVGWGTVSFGGAASPILRQVTIPIWKNEDCDRAYLLEDINESFMCAGSQEKGEDACQGDSGGPLMSLNDQGRWEVIGIVSWGRRCGDPSYPGVYTRVTTYLDWINENAV